MTTPGVFVILSINERPTGLGQASMAAVRQYVRAAQSFGLAVDEALREADISADALTQDWLPGERFQALIRALTRQSADPIFGLKTGDFVQPGSYSVLGHITLSCTTLGEAIARISPFEKLVGDMGVTTVTSQGDQLLLDWHCNYVDAVVRPQMIDNVFASWTGFARWLADYDGAGPSGIWLERADPGVAARREYLSRFHCEVNFAQPFNRIAVPMSLLSLPLRAPDPSLLRTLEDHAQQKMAALASISGPWTTRVRNAILQQLRQGVTRKDLIAEQLEVNARTLQRRLQDEGASYQELLDGLREELARDYLRAGHLSMQDIADRLGFTEVRSFHRSFKSWTGQTPGEYRDGGDRKP